MRHPALPGVLLRIPKIGLCSMLVANTGHIICFLRYGVLVVCALSSFMGILLGGQALRVLNAKTCCLSTQLVYPITFPTS